MQTATEHASRSEERLGGSLTAIASDFAARGSDVQARIRLLLEYAGRLQPMDPASKIDANRVMGCTAQVPFTSYG